MSGWPWPGDTELAKARKIAIAYRTHLHTANPGVCDALDEAMRAYGQTWVVPMPVIDDDGMGDITTREAADLVGVSVDTIRQWACTPHPDVPGAMLLPRFKMRGRERTYLASHVREAKAVATSRRLARRSPDRAGGGGDL